MVSSIKELQQEYEISVEYIKKHGTSFYFGSKLFNKEQRMATSILYAFVRYPDEIVDNARNSLDNTKQQQELDQWIAQWEDVWNKKIDFQEAHPILRGAYVVFQTYDMPFSLSEAFFASMKRDLWKEEYATYKELEDYMYGSATVVGYMMTRLIGYKDDTAFSHAKDLAEALQLTNFLRDVREDYDELGRIYLPQEDMKKFGVTKEMIAAHQVTPELVALMKYYIEFSRKLYISAREGVILLHKNGHAAVLASADIYEAILDEIERHDYDIFRYRCGMPKWKKLLTFGKYYFKKS
jgi:phytoene synthase